MLEQRMPAIRGVNQAGIETPSVLDQASHQLDARIQNLAGVLLILEQQVVPVCCSEKVWPTSPGNPTTDDGSSPVVGILYTYIERLEGLRVKVKALSDRLQT